MVSVVAGMCGLRGSGSSSPTPRHCVIGVAPVSTSSTLLTRRLV
ncbi:MULTISPECIES: hypothetical protein [Nocardiopsis]|uniref:Uncharacterized protein n=1 Tax=Nocardiopsis tropica TaxID=109330 RepID=A0ABV2A405_9ACTN